MQHSTTTRIEMDANRAFEIRPAGREFAAVLVTQGKPDYEVRRFPTQAEALGAAHRWAQAEHQQTVMLREWRGR